MYGGRAYDCSKEGAEGLCLIPAAFGADIKPDCRSDSLYSYRLVKQQNPE